MSLLRLLARLFVLCTTLSCIAASAEDFPSKVLKIVVPYPGGSYMDIIVRIVAQQLSVNVRQPVIVDNRPGANGILGSEFVARSDPDGYTMLAVNPAHVINPSLKPRMPFDWFKDFAPISMIGATPGVLLVHPSLPVKTVRELISYAKTKPGQLNYGSGGVGSAVHLQMEMLKAETSIDIVHVPYRSNAAALSELVAGRIQILIDGYGTANPHIESGAVRILAVGSLARFSHLPDVPPIAADLPGYEATTWWGLLASSRTPSNNLQRLSAEVRKAIDEPKVKERLVGLGVEVVGSTPDQFSAHLQRAGKRFSEIAKRLGIQIE